VGLRILCALQLAVVVCFAFDAQAFDGATELVQVLEASNPEDGLPKNMDDMKAMINSAMQETEKRDLGESSAQAANEMSKEMDEISAAQAVKDEMEMESPKNCVMSAWSKWTKCTKKCGGGTRTRTRKVLEYDQNGGKACPKNDDGTPFNEEEASCNIESCADEEAAHQEKIRHLTDIEVQKESMINNKIKNRALNARTVEDMQRELHHWMDKSVKTKMVHVVLPGESPPTDEEQVQTALQKAIAKNNIKHAMDRFREEQKSEGKEDAK
jgi:hypothetical protein